MFDREALLVDEQADPWKTAGRGCVRHVQFLAIDRDGEIDNGLAGVGLKAVLREPVQQFLQQQSHALLVAAHKDVVVHKPHKHLVRPADKLAQVPGLQVAVEKAAQKS